MTKKHATFVSLIFIMAVGMYFFFESLSLNERYPNEIVGPGYLPFWLSIILFILCIISFVKTLVEKKSEKFTIPQLKYIIFTAIITVLFCFSWSKFGYFYLQSFVYLLILLTVYRSSLGWTFKNIMINVVTAAGYTTFLYVLFGLIVQIRL